MSILSIFKKMSEPQYQLSAKGECMKLYCENIINEKPQGEIENYESLLTNIRNKFGEYDLSRKDAANIWLQAVNKVTKSN